MPKQNPPRQRIRLPAEVYAELSMIGSIPSAVTGRAPVIACPAVAAPLPTCSGVPVYAWCVMPDHVHLILGASATCDMVTVVGQFTHLAQRDAWRRGIKGAFWQTSFWDHFLRDDERTPAGDKPPPYTEN